MRLEVYSGGSRRQDPSGAVLPAPPAAGGAHSAGGKPRCKLGPRGTWPASLSLLLRPGGSPESTHTSQRCPSHPWWPHLRSSPPQSLPAGSCPWPGPPRHARPGPGWCPFSVCGAWPAGAARRGGRRRVGAQHRPTPSRVSSPPRRAGGGAHLSPGPQAADSTPPAVLKGAARRRGDGAPRATALPRPGGAEARRRFPAPSPLRRPLSCQLQNLGPARRRCSLVPVIIHIASNIGNDCRNIFAKFIHYRREEGMLYPRSVGRLFTCENTSSFKLKQC